jgi:hypothetical protein
VSKRTAISLGDAFGLWTVNGVRIGKRVSCKCACGTERNVLVPSLLSGHSRSCGCAPKSPPTYTATSPLPYNPRAPYWRHGHTNVSTDGDRRRASSEYRCWRAMVARCCNEKHDAYSRYGGAGITIHGPWREDFAEFLRDMGPRPTPQHSLDRYPNQSGNYEPGNVRWATRGEQARNRSANTLLTHNGETMCIADWEAKTGISRYTISSRLNVSKWSVDRALTQVPAQKPRRKPAPECPPSGLALAQDPSTPVVGARETNADPHGQ